jgi:hypothetical protein
VKNAVYWTHKGLRSFERHVDIRIVLEWKLGKAERDKWIHLAEDGLQQQVQVSH